MNLQQQQQPESQNQQILVLPQTKLDPRVRNFFSKPNDVNNQNQDDLLNPTQDVQKRRNSQQHLNSSQFINTSRQNLSSRNINSRLDLKSESSEEEYLDPRYQQLSFNKRGKKMGSKSKTMRLNKQMDQNLRNAIELRQKKSKITDFYVKLTELKDRIEVYQMLFQTKQPRFVTQSKYMQNKMRQIDKQQSSNKSSKKQLVKKKTGQIQVNRRASTFFSQSPNNQNRNGTGQLAKRISGLSDRMMFQSQLNKYLSDQQNTSSMKNLNKNGVSVNDQEINKQQVNLPQLKRALTNTAQTTNNYNLLTINTIKINKNHVTRQSRNVDERSVESDDSLASFSSHGKQSSQSALLSIKAGGLSIDKLKQNNDSPTIQKSKFANSSNTKTTLEAKEKQTIIQRKTLEKAESNIRESNFNLDIKIGGLDDKSFEKQNKQLQDRSYTSAQNYRRNLNYSQESERIHQQFENQQMRKFVNNQEISYATRREQMITKKKKLFNEVFDTYERTVLQQNKNSAYQPLQQMQTLQSKDSQTSRPIRVFHFPLKLQHRLKNKTSIDFNTQELTNFSSKINEQNENFPKVGQAQHQDFNNNYFPTISANLKKSYKKQQ
eukprot:403352382